MEDGVSCKPEKRSLKKEEGRVWNNKEETFDVTSSGTSFHTSSLLTCIRAHRCHVVPRGLRANCKHILKGRKAFDSGLSLHTNFLIDAFPFDVKQN